MSSAYSILQWIGVFAWPLLGFLAFRSWIKRRDAASAWLSATFATLGFVVIAGRFTQNFGHAPWEIWSTKLLIAILALFPYFLYRFTTTFLKYIPWLRWSARLLTGAVIISALLLPDVPRTGDPRPGYFSALVVLLLLQWTYLSVVVVVRLWRSGKKLPSVTRRRMRTLAAGAAGLAIALLIAGSAPAGREVSWAQIGTQVLALLSGPLFLLGFAPPSIVLSHWRSEEEQALSEVQVALVKALSQTEIAQAILPRVIGLLGGKGAAILNPEGKTLGVLALDEEDLQSIRRRLPENPESYKAIKADGNLVLSMDSGWLIVTISSFTPYFGDVEITMVEGLSALTDLALARARSFQLQQQATDAMRDFIAIASHDLRTPVTVINGLQQTMQQKWDAISDDQKKEFNEAIGRQTRQLNRLIHDLLTVSKVETDEVEVVPTVLDVVPMLHETLSSLASDVQTSYEGPQIAMVFADLDHVERILQNYVRNALVHGAPPIETKVLSESGSVIVEVRDHGPGVPPEFAPRLFEKFARADKKKSRATGGTGLGLSIVRGLARANGGEAWFQSVEGCTCFAVRLPSDDGLKEGP